MKRTLTFLLFMAVLHPVVGQTEEGARKSAGEMVMVPVEGGTFDMGSNDEATDRKPAHTVKLKNFSISAYEVTQAQWQEVMGANPSLYTQAGDHPVNNVSWNDVQVFIEKLNAKTGHHYRLPTEAEWEYAARGGEKEHLVKESKVVRGGVNEFLISDKGARRPEVDRTGKKYSGRRAGPQEIAWYKNNSRDKVHAVGGKKPNELGIYDMSGNVEEWCSDYYATSYGGKDLIENPKGPSFGRSRVVRGGSYASEATELVVTRRAAYLPDTKSVSLGFRLVEDK